MLALSTAASVGGNLIQNSEAEANAKRVAAARNAQLQFVLGKEHEIENQNEARLAKGIDQFQQPQQQQAQKTAVDTRNTAIDANAPNPTAQAGSIPLSGNAPKVITGKIASAMKSAFDSATDTARKAAQLGSYNDVLGGNSRTLMDLGSNIDTDNGKARAWATLLPSLQDLAGESVNKPPSGIGQVLSGLGTLGAGFAGSGMKLFPTTTPAANAFNAAQFGFQPVNI